MLTLPSRYIAESHKEQLKHQIRSFSDTDRYAASSSFPSMPDVESMIAAKQVKQLEFDVEPGAFPFALAGCVL